MLDSDDYSDHFSPSELPEDESPWDHSGPPVVPSFSAEGDSAPTVKDSLCLGLVAQVQEMTDLETLKGRHVARIIQHNLQRVLDAASQYGYELPHSNPFTEGQVPYLDYYSGDIRVRVNGLLRKYELHSSGNRLGDRLLTPDEFVTLTHWVDYLITLGNRGDYDEVPYALSCLNTWVQTL